MARSVVGRARHQTGLVLPLAAAHAGVYLALLPPAVVTLALRVQEIDPVHRGRTLSLVLAIGAAGGLLSQNLVGAFSDRTSSRFGMRRPWILAGSCTAIISVIGLAAAPNVPVLIVAWAATVVSYNAVLAGLGPLLSEHVEPDRRGRVAGVIGAMPPFGAIVGVAMVTVLLPSLTMALVVPAVIGIVGIAWLMLRIPDRRLAKGSAQPWRVRDLAAAFWVNPKAHPDFAWAWASRLLVLLGAGALVSYRPYFLQDSLGVSADGVAEVVLNAGVLSTVAAVVSGPLAGRLSDRLQRRKVILVVAGLLLAAMHAITAATSSLTVFYAASAVAGAALGSYLAVDLAVFSVVLPSSETFGKDMGVVHLATALPQFIVPILAQPLLAGGNGDAAYRALYAGAALAGVLGALLILRVRAAP